MKEFYDHIREFAEAARQHGDGKAIIVYIHGMSDNSQNIGVDIGFGAKYHPDFALSFIHYTSLL